MYIVKVQIKIIEKKAERVYDKWKLAKEPFF